MSMEHSSLILSLSTASSTRATAKAYCISLVPTKYSVVTLSSSSSDRSVASSYSDDWTRSNSNAIWRSRSRALSDAGDPVGSLAGSGR